VSGGGVGVRVVTSGVDPAAAASVGVAIVRLCDVGVDEQQPAASATAIHSGSSSSSSKGRYEREARYVCEGARSLSEDNTAAV